MSFRAFNNIHGVTNGIQLRGIPQSSALKIKTATGKSKASFIFPVAVFIYS
jgi:hypothetical protein